MLKCRCWSNNKKNVENTRKIWFGSNWNKNNSNKSTFIDGSIAPTDPANRKQSTKILSFSIEPKHELDFGKVEYCWWLHMFTSLFSPSSVSRYNIISVSLSIRKFKDIHSVIYEEGSTHIITVCTMKHRPQGNGQQLQVVLLFCAFYSMPFLPFPCWFEIERQCKHCSSCVRICFLLIFLFIATILHLICLTVIYWF